MSVVAPPRPCKREVLEPIRPFSLGPSWQRDEDGEFVYPELTIGPWVIAWIAENLQIGGAPIVLTDEQERLVQWVYAIDEHGRWLFDDFVIQRLKGWGKDPIAAILSAVEFIGPCRFSHFATERDVELYARLGYEIEVGDPIAKEQVDAWVQIFATASEQTKNTAIILQTIFTPACKERYGLDIGKEKIYAADGRRIEIASSAWRTTEGNRTTWAVRNETHHWRQANEGDELHGVIRRNLAKMDSHGARGISITNAYRPGEGSVGEMQRRKYEDAIELRGHSRVMYDTLEAPKGTPLVPKFTRVEEVDGQLYAITEYHDDGTPVEPSYETAKWWLEYVIDAVRGDAHWLNPQRLADEILTGEIPGEEALRFYFNSSETAEDTYLDAADIEATADPVAQKARRSLEFGDPLRAGWRFIDPDDPVVIFGDGSKSNDATGLVGCRVRDGYLFTIGVWQRPRGAKSKVWSCPRDEVDARVQEALGRFNVVGFWFDPSHTVEDETGAGYWDSLVDSWHQQFGDRLAVWAQISGDRRSSVSWDMTSPARQIDFVHAVAQFAEDMRSHSVSHDAHPSLVRHMQNARNFWTKAGWSISKASRGSQEKIDLCVCAVGARLLRRVYLNRQTEQAKKDVGKQPGRVWF